MLVINLVRKNKVEEHTLTEALIKMFQIIKVSKVDEEEPVRKNVKHVMFDFHSETKGDNFTNLNKFTDEIADIQERFGFFTGLRFHDAGPGDADSSEPPSWATDRLSMQRGVFRTNCIDCLDRTNVTQTRICLQAVYMIMARIFELNLARHNIQSQPKKMRSSIEFNEKYKHPLYLSL